MPFSLKSTEPFRSACLFLSQNIKKQKNGTYKLTRADFQKSQQLAEKITDVVQRDLFTLSLRKMDEQSARSPRSSDLVFVHPALAHLIKKETPELFETRAEAAMKSRHLLLLKQSGLNEQYVQLAELLVRYSTCPIFEVTFRRLDLPTRMGRLAEHEPFLIDEYYGLVDECQSRVAEIFRDFARSWKKRFPNEELLLTAFDGSEDSREFLKGKSLFAGYHNLFAVEINDWESLYFDPWFLQNNDVKSVVRAGEFVARRQGAIVVGTYGRRVGK